MRMLRSASALFAFVAVASLLFASQSGQQPGTSSASAEAIGGQVHSITLPDISTEIPKGPHVDTFDRNCLTCHSARYVLTQPPFSKAVWESEVKKMVAAYGAPISAQDQERIVEYLDAINGAKSPQTAAPPK